MSSELGGPEPTCLGGTRTSLPSTGRAFGSGFFKRLKLVRTYRIAVGQAGFETPAGLYHVQNKAVKPSWSVPNKPLAGLSRGTSFRRARTTRSRAAG